MFSSDAPARSERRPVVRSRAVRRWFNEAAGVIVSTSLAALVILAADQLYRPEWDFSWADHWMGAPILFMGPAALIGLLWSQVQLVQEGLSQRFRSRPRRRDWVRAGIVATLAALGCTWFALKTFSGAGVSQTWLAWAGPPLFLLAVAAFVFVCALIMWRVQRRAALGRPALGVLYGTLLSAFGCGALYVDMNAYVGLYGYLHTFLELLAFALLVGGFQVLGFVLTRLSAWTLPVTRVLAGALLALGIVFVAYRPLRTWTDAQLAHAWVDEIYVGRALRRTQLMELQLTGGESLRVARMEQIARRFEVKDDSLAPQWLETTTHDAGLSRVKNLLFFYVDTLRADVAADEKLMPELARLKSQALDYRRAYATGSDTLRSLPTINRGNYFLDKKHPGELLRLAKESRLHTKIILAQSASDFLQKLLPTFSFDQKIEVPDHREGTEVWGYGADLPTATGVGDATVDFLESPRAKQPFLLWSFHFDIHAWREIGEDYIEAQRQRLGVPSEGELSVRYRVIARTIDEQLGRVLRSLKKTGRDQDTALVFLSDHGEGLGQGGFWVHSIFLWESLIHVPLVMKIPGEAPRVIDEAVSLVDVTPTLAPLFGRGTAVYHGEDILSPEYTAAGRRLPILLRAGQFQGHDRAGIIDPRSRRKLVLRLEAAFPELIAYETDRYDAFNLSRKEPALVKRLVRTLARSPVYPRADEDFELNSEPDELAHDPPRP